MRSGHESYQTLYATNDVETEAFTVNRLGAPNDSTVMVSSSHPDHHIQLMNYEKAFYRTTF